MAQDKVWWYAKEDQRFGPYSTSELKEIATAGQLASTDLIWKEGLANWLSASSVKGLLPAKVPVVPPPIPLVQKDMPHQIFSTPAEKAEHSRYSSANQAVHMKGIPKKLESDNSAAIWNPGSAISWSLAFSPVFGAYIHALNWRALNEENRYAKAMVWCYIGIAVLIAAAFMKKGGVALAFWYLVIWYFAAGKSQAKYVKEKFGNNYPRQAWGKPLAIAGVIFLAYCFVAAVL